MPMFKKLVRFYGKHAYTIQKYCKDKGGEQDVPFVVNNNTGEEKTIYIFENRAYLYLVAGMLGIIKKRTAPIDHSINIYSSIMPEMLEKQRENLERMYHHMILSEDDGLNPDSKIKKAFTIKKSDEEWDEEQKRLESYVRGGLEIIAEIFDKCKSYEDVCNAMYDLNGILDLSNIEQA